MDVISSIGGTLSQHRQGASATTASGAGGHPQPNDAAAATTETVPYRLASASSSASANDVSGAFHETFKTTLAEADSYLNIFEARVKLEEDYVKGLKTLADKQRDVDLKLDSRLSVVLNLEPGGAEWPGARQAWKELRANDLRELDTRQHYIETLRQGVIAPLTVFRDSQERIRKRVKEDLKTSIGRYDEMRNTTLPRAKKAYEKRCDEVEQLRLQQQAIEDQRTLLSPPSMAMARDASGTGSSRAGEPSSPLGDDDDDTGSRSDTARTSLDASSIGASSAPRRSKSTHRSKPHNRNSSRSSLRSDEEPMSPRTNPSPRIGGDAGLFASSPTKDGEKSKGPGHFLDALRSRENWEAARKEAPKKINALLSRMGGSGATSNVSHDRSPPSGAVEGGALGVHTGGEGGIGLGGVVLGNSSGSMRSNQNLALKSVKAKREAEEADKAYRKMIFDLETLRLRRNKTLRAALASVVECRRELHLTCQAVWMQAERSGLVMASSHSSLRTHAEEVLQTSLVHLDDELVMVEKRLPSLSETHDSRVAYVNYQYGECKDLIFGVSLIDYAFTRAQQSAPTLGGPTKVQPPLIVRKCIQFIEERALDHQGIYRISAKHTAIQNLAHALEKDEERFQFRPEADEPATVAGVLKLYLRQLPEPVMPIPWEERIRHTQERDEQIQTGFANLKGRIRRLPQINQETLKLIVGHLAKVAAHSEKNKMNANNLSIVFGPLLLSQADHETTSIAAAMEEDRVTEDLILYAADIFDLSHAGAPVLPNIRPSMPPLDFEGVTNGVEEAGHSDVRKVEDAREASEGLEKPNEIAVESEKYPISASTSGLTTKDAAQHSQPLAAPLPVPTAAVAAVPAGPISSSADVPLVLSGNTDLKRSDAIGRGNTLPAGNALSLSDQPPKSAESAAEAPATIEPHPVLTSVTSAGLQEAHADPPATLPQIAPAAARGQSEETQTGLAKSVGSPKPIEKELSEEAAPTKDRLGTNGEDPAPTATNMGRLQDI